jgi:hypothetical protein
VRFGNDRSPLPEYYFVVSRLGAAALPQFHFSRAHNPAQAQRIGSESLTLAKRIVY